MTMACSKLWIDQRRTLWVTAEMMADLYNHDLYSRDVATIRRDGYLLDSRNPNL
jgi:hypothetical protein